jgi:integrase
MTRRTGGRRADGESSIHQDASGRWHGYVSMRTTLAGKADRRHVSAKPRAAVVERVRGQERRRDAGVITAPGRLTVEDWLTQWLTRIAPRRVRESTLTGYEVVVRRHLVPGIGHHSVDRLQPEHLERLYDDLLDKGLARRMSCSATGCCRGR